AGGIAGLVRRHATGGGGFHPGPAAAAPAGAGTAGALPPDAADHTDGAGTAAGNRSPRPFTTRGEGNPLNLENPMSDVSRQPLPCSPHASPPGRLVLATDPDGTLLAGRSEERRQATQRRCSA